MRVKILSPAMSVTLVARMSFLLEKGVQVFSAREEFPVAWVYGGEDSDILKLATAGIIVVRFD